MGRDDGGNLAKEELLFMHLLRNNHYRGHYIVPEVITEKGIKCALGCDLSLISRLLKKNEEKGYIYRVLSKVENKKRKQNAFFLTEEGVRIARELVNEEDFFINSKTINMENFTED